MHHIHLEAQRNVEPQPHPEAPISVLVHLLHQHAGSFVLTTSQVAALVGKSEAGLRLAESRHRSKHGCDLLPSPLLQNAEGRVWSIAQIAQWLVLGGVDLAVEANPPTRTEKPAKLLGRPRKLLARAGELA